MPTALSSQSMTVKVSVNGSGTENVTGTDYKALTQSLSIAKSVGPFTTAVANNASLGADETASFIVSIAASGTGTVDCTNLTDILLRTGVSLARVKAYVIRLLSTTDDSVNGTLCTGVLLNSTGTNLIVLPGITNTTLGNGEVLAWATVSATGVTVDSTHKIINVLNNDASHAAAVQVTLVGGTT